MREFVSVMFVCMNFFGSSTLAEYIFVKIHPSPLPFKVKCSTPEVSVRIHAKSTLSRRKAGELEVKALVFLLIYPGEGITYERGRNPRPLT